MSGQKQSQECVDKTSSMEINGADVRIIQVKRDPEREATYMAQLRTQPLVQPDGESSSR